MPESTADGLRTLLVGIDGASMDVLADRGEGVVPTITELLEEGASGTLESQIPPWTPSAWPSVFTGVNPGKHGVFGFLRFEGYDWDVVNYDDVQAHAIWELLDEQGHESVVVNVPVTHPPKSFDGALVPGYTAPEEPECHPPGLLDDLQAEIGEYRVYDDETDPTDDAATRIEGYERLVESRGEAFRYLADRFDPDFGFLQFQQTDTVFHESPEEDAVVDAVYAAVDREIEATLEACDPDVVLLVSDHGIGPYDGHEFRANSFLRDRGDVATTAGEGGMPSWSSIARNELQTNGDGTGAGAADESGTAAPTLTERSLSVAARAGLTSQRIERVVRRLGIEDLVLRIAPADAVRAASERVDFERSRAYVRDRIELGVRINLEGREPEGVVPESEYESLRTELIDALRDVRTPDGDPVFETVKRREDVFEGPHLEDAPDIVVVPAAFDQFLSASLRDEQFGPPSEPWNHKRNGIVVAAGDVDVPAGDCSAVGADADAAASEAGAAPVDADAAPVADGAAPANTDATPAADSAAPATDAAAPVDADAASDAPSPVGPLADAHLFDVAPTVLATLGVPADERMDGDVLPITEPAGVEAYPEYQDVRSNSTSDGESTDATDGVGTADGARTADGVRTNDGASAADGQRAGDAVEARLADMGYLER